MPQAKKDNKGSVCIAHGPQTRRNLRDPEEGIDAIIEKYD